MGEEISETKFMVGDAYGRHVEAIISCGPEADRQFACSVRPGTFTGHSLG